MFNLLKNKIRFSIIITIILTLIALCCSSYVIMSDMIINDYIQKSINFSKQIAKNINIQMQYIEYTSNLFLSKTSIGDNIVKKDYLNLNNIIGEIKKYNSAINGAVFYANGRTYATDSYYKKVMEAFVNKDLKNGKAEWIYLKLNNEDYIPYKKEILFCILPVCDSNKNMVGILAVDVDINALKQNLSENNIFIKDSSIYLYYGYTAIKVQGVDQDDISLAKNMEVNTYSFDKKKGIIYKIQIEDSQNGVLLFLPLSSAHFQLRFIAIIMILMVSAILVLCFVTVNRMTLNIVGMLNSLYCKMENYNGQKETERSLKL